MSPKAKQDPQGNAAEDKSYRSSQEEGAAQSKLPFEPAQTRKKTAKQASTSKNKPIAKAKSTGGDASSSASSQPAKQGRGAIGVPKVVSTRMVRRMAFFSGLPTFLGMFTFVASYIVVSQEWLKVPNVAVVLVSLGCFGLGVIGLSYGVLSASWDEERVGSWLGWGEFATNFGRVVESWRSQGKEPNA